MVGLFKALLPPLLLATFAAAQNDFQITNPSTSSWWVAKSENVLAWDCSSSQATIDNNFTVLINNIDPKVFQGPLAVIAVQSNSACSIDVSQDQVSQPAGTGYVITMADPLNNTNVFATSQQFQIKPLGSLYPSQVSSSASGASGTNAGSGSLPSNSATSGAALSPRINPSLLGLTGVIGLLAVGLLGA